MTVKINCFFLFALLSLSILQLNAQNRQHGWPCQPFDDNSCIGSINLQVDKAFWSEAVGVFEISSFSNGEWLFVNRTTDPIIKILQFRESHEIYYGVRNPEEERRQRHIFQQGAGRVLFVVLGLIFEAHPDGIDAMPSVWTTREVASEGKKIQVSVRKTSPKSFEFRSSSDPDWDVSGLWSIEKVQHWPDSYSLDGWTNQRQVSFRTLGDLRERIRKSWQR